ncbi:MAG: tRNA glutamyl-Q(34) synthetase GluQRS [Granulosicoccus sp.]|nr:tRNA glutamyl-Q(34) synthetase GluQRS [Granulosicoccus sp.]
MGRPGNDPATGIIGRFAPSPTGDLHFGSLLAALASFCDARHQRGQWLLRIDDIDEPRSVPGSADAIQRTLERYGFHWDGPVRWQSNRQERYVEALSSLVESGLIFACDCSRRSLPTGQVYPGRCRHRRVSDLPVMHHALRLSLSGTVYFDDAIQGVQRFDLAVDVGDSIVWRRDGLVSYALACAVDDADQVTHVVRGADLLEGTGVQLGIIEALGLTPPIYAHLPVAVNTDGDKLSKHSRAPAISELEPVAVLQRAWQVLGQAPLTSGSVGEFWSEAIPAWDIRRVPQQRRCVV